MRGTLKRVRGYLAGEGERVEGERGEGLKARHITDSHSGATTQCLRYTSLEREPASQVGAASQFPPHFLSSVGSTPPGVPLSLQTELPHCREGCECRRSKERAPRPRISISEEMRSLGFPCGEAGVWGRREGRGGWMHQFVPG